MTERATPRNEAWDEKDKQEGNERDAGVYEKYMTARARQPNEVQGQKDRQVPCAGFLVLDEAGNE